MATSSPAVIVLISRMRQPRIVNYPFTFIELRMSGEGAGEGKLALATQVNVSDNGKFVELVNYRQQPIQLKDVRRQ